MQKPTPSEWIASCGEERNRMRVGESLENNRRFYEQGQGELSQFAFPAWELLEVMWDETEHDWPNRWLDCGGKFFAGRMIAAKWDEVWGKLAGSFSDGLNQPYPPYSARSRMMLGAVRADEAFALGVLTKEERDTRFPRRTSGKSFDPALLARVRCNLEKRRKELGVIISQQKAETTNKSS